jgi:hypothetical protein
MDGAATMGIATTRELERVAAAMGLLEAAPLRFEPAADLPDGGTLCALPALLAFGLLDHQAAAGLTLPKGFLTGRGGSVQAWLPTVGRRRSSACGSCR